MANDFDFIQESPFWEQLRKWVQKIPTSAYYTIWIVVTTLEVIIIKYPAKFGIDPGEEWVAIAAIVVSQLISLFTRPKSPVDTALEEAAQARSRGRIEESNVIANKVVNTYTARLSKAL